MGQKEVLEALQDKNWRSQKEINEMLKQLSVSSINTSLRRLTKYGFIIKKHDKEKKYGYLYKQQKE